MTKTSGVYQDVFIRREGVFVSLKEDVTAFCEKYIKPVHPRNWDWSKRDFENAKNDPTIEEIRAIRDVIYKDLSAKKGAADSEEAQESEERERGIAFKTH